MNVDEFIFKLNSGFPSIDQIISKFRKTNKQFDQTEAIEYQKRNQISFNTNILPYSNELEHLIKNTNMYLVGIGALNFRNSIRQIGDSLQEFASYNDYYLLCFNPLEKCVASFTEEFSEYEVISTTIDQFFSFLYIYECRNRYLIFGCEFSEDQVNIELNNLIKNGLSKSWAEELIIKGLF